MAPSDDETRSRRVATLSRARLYGVVLITGALGAGVFLSELERIREAPASIMNYAYIALLSLVGALIFAWIWATEHELDLLLRWVELHSYDPPSGVRETGIIVGMGALLVGLFYAARNPLAFGCIFAAYSLGVLLAVRHMNRNELEEAFRDAEDHLERLQEGLPDRKDIGPRQTGIGILRHYFLVRPHTPRHWAILLLSIGGLIPATAWWSTRNQVLGAATYALYIAIILVSEAVIFRWRVVRDDSLRQVRRGMRVVGVTPP